jgi:hypothetical protein
MTRVRDLHEQWSNDPEYMEEYERLSTEFELAKAIIEARTKAGLTQEENFAICCCTYGKRQRASLCQYIEEISTSYGNPSQNNI